jgi:molybdopterin molybdotransferase
MLMSATPEFFRVQPPAIALEGMFAACPLRPQAEVMATTEALGRVLTAAPRSTSDLPAFPRSSMDGYAVRARDTFGASPALPAYLTCVGSVPMGTASTVLVEAGQAAEIFTGAMLPSGADAVVMVEQTQVIGAKASGTWELEVLAPVAPGENVVQIGEDVTGGEAILPSGHQLRSADIGGLLAVGILTVEVAARPRVAILSGGDELVPPEQSPTLGQVRDINAHTLAALCHEAGASTTLLGISRDHFDEMFRMARDGLAAADMLVLTAGSSISTRDLTRAVIEALGPPGVIQHGLAVKPGKPTILAACGSKPVIGLPGNPVSALLVARQIIVPIIARMLGGRPRPRATVRAILGANVPSATGREDTIPVRLIERDGTLMAEPVFGKSNLIYMLVRADGLIVIPLNSGGLKAGVEVEVIPF